MHHAAETDIEKIVDQRVNAAIHSIRMSAQSLRSSFPELESIISIIIIAFDTNASREHISQVAINLDLMVGNTHIGSVDNGPLFYYNAFTIEEIKYKLVKECSKKVVDEKKTDVKNKVSSHIVSELKAKDIFTGTLDKIVDSFEESFGQFFGVLFGTIFATVLFLVFETPVLIATQVLRFFVPVDVNDPEWRSSCVVVVHVKLQKKKSSMVSELSRAMNEKFTLSREKLNIFLSRFPSDSTFRYSFRYDGEYYVYCYMNS